MELIACLVVFIGVLAAGWNFKPLTENEKHVLKGHIGHLED